LTIEHEHAYRVEEKFAERLEQQRCQIGRQDWRTVSHDELNVEGIFVAHPSHQPFQTGLQTSLLKDRRAQLGG
jgi:hypothetical protein